MIHVINTANSNHDKRCCNFKIIGKVKMFLVSIIHAQAYGNSSRQLYTSLYALSFFSDEARNNFVKMKSHILVYVV